MGFFNALLRIAKGQPVFQVSDRPPDEQASNQEVPHEAAGLHTPQTAVKPHTPAGPKVLPQMFIEDAQCQNTDGHMECEVTLKNRSHEQLELEKIEILGKTIEYNQFIGAGGAFEAMLYAGPRRTNNFENQCRVTYKNAAGDYFCTEHYVEFVQHPDNTFAVSRIRFQAPVRDI